MHANRNQWPLLVLGLSLLIAPGAVAQKTTIPTDEDSKKTRRELRAAVREVDDLFTKCKYCKGKGKIYEHYECADCDGAGRVIAEKHQEFLDTYIRLCDLLEKHAAYLEKDERTTKRCHKARDDSMIAIRRESGVIKQKGRTAEAGEAKYRGKKFEDGEYNRLVRRMTGMKRKDPTDHGISLAGKVVEVLEKDKLRVAEVRIDSAGFSSRTCYVIVPAEAKWKATDKVRVIGKVIKGEDERKALSLDEDLLLVKSYYGTE